MRFEKSYLLCLLHAGPLHGLGTLEIVPSQVESYYRVMLHIDPQVDVGHKGKYCQAMLRDKTCTPAPSVLDATDPPLAIENGGGPAELIQELGEDVQRQSESLHIASSFSVVAKTRVRRCFFCVTSDRNHL